MWRRISHTTMGRITLGVLSVIFLLVMSGVGYVTYIRLRHSAAISPTPLHVSYSVTDLGATTVNYSADYSSPDGHVQVNAYGQIAGDLGSKPIFWTPTAPHGSTGSFLDFRGIFANQWPRLAKEVGAPLPSGFFFLGAINAYGQVAGVLRTAFGPDYNGYGVLPFLWTPTHPNGMSGVITLLDVKAISSKSEVVISLNSWGQVLLETAAGDHGLLWTPTTPNGRVGSISYISPFRGDTDVSLARLNDYGQVIAASQRGSFDSANNLSHLYLWTPNVAHGAHGVITLIDASFGYVQAINFYGQVLGYTASADGPLESYLWTPLSPHGVKGTKTFIHPLIGDSDLELDDLSDTGAVVGTSDSNTYVLWGDTAVAWLPSHPNSPTGQLLSLGRVGDASDSYGAAISPMGSVVGWSCVVSHTPAPFCSDTLHLFIWDAQHGSHDVNALLPPNERQALTFSPFGVQAINNGNEIAVFVYEGDTPHLVLLVPHPAG